MKTLGRDEILYIMDKMDDLTLVNYCQTDKATRSLCNQESFWQRRLLNRSGLSLNILMKYKLDKSWNEYYIEMKRYIDMSEEDIEDIQEVAQLSAEDDRLDILMLMVSKGADINDPEIFELSVINKDIVEYLLNEGVEPNDDIMDQVLEIGDIETIKLLSKYLYKNMDMYLDEASYKGNIELVRFLHQLGAIINPNNNIYLLRAIDGYRENYYEDPSGNEAVIRYLVDHGVNVTIPNHEPALRAAFDPNDQKILLYILQHY
jgi:hypothetical protein